MSRFCFIAIVLLFTASHSYSQPESATDKPYLLILDVQDQFYAGSDFEKSAVEMVEVINSLVEMVPADRIIYVVSAGKVLSVSKFRFRVDTLAAPPMDTRLKLVNQNIFMKAGTGDAFESAELVGFLKKRGVTSIWITGLLAEKCISATTLGGLQRGFRMSLIPEAVTGKSEKSKAAALAKLFARGAGSIPVSEVRREE